MSISILGDIVFLLKMNFHEGSFTFVSASVSAFVR
jgi:hypothetical protein